jgi:hypothetical protein
MSANARRKVKKIDKLVSDANVVVTTQDDLCDVAKNYFDTLFQASGGVHEPVLSIIQPKVSETDNERLTAQF